MGWTKFVMCNYFYVTSPALSSSMKPVVTGHLYNSFVQDRWLNMHFEKGILLRFGPALYLVMWSQKKSSNGIWAKKIQDALVFDLFFFFIHTNLTIPLIQTLHSGLSKGESTSLAKGDLYLVCINSLTGPVKCEKKNSDNNHFIIASFLCNSGKCFKKKDPQGNS